MIPESGAKGHGEEQAISIGDIYEAVLHRGAVPEYLAGLRWKTGYICRNAATVMHTGWPTDGINAPSAVTRFQ